MAEQKHSSRDTRRPMLLLVGWDGATPELLERFTAAGKLPTIHRVMQSGSYRRLRSTIPPVTACAWSSFLSGKNPGKHGLFDFVTPRKGSYNFDYTNGGYRKDRHDDLLALLNRGGLRVGCVNVPMTYPPTPIEGFTISGLDAPDEKSNIALPAELFEDAQKQVGSYRIDNRHLGAMKTEADRRKALEEFKRIETLRTDITLAMTNCDPVDVLVIVYNATDQVQHHFWHLMDSAHPAHPGPQSPEVIAFQHAIEEIYAHCDAELGRLLKAFPDANMMLLSDHGAGPTTGPRVRLNNVLAKKGLLTWSQTNSSLGADFISRVDGFLRRTLSAKQKAGLTRLIPGGRSRIESMGLPNIDWSKTAAFCYEGFTLSPCVWINRRDFFPAGTVDSGEAYERTCRQVIDVLNRLKDLKTAEPVIPRIYRSKEIYSGPYQPAAPDLILDWWEGRTFTMAQSHPKLMDQPAVFYPESPAIPGKDITGIHRRDGVLVAWGDGFATLGGPLPAPADLMDITPTTLALMGLPIPSDIDGKVLQDCLAGDVRPERSTESPAAPDDTEKDGEATAYSDREREIIEQRLSGLGYLE